MAPRTFQPYKKKAVKGNRALGELAAMRLRRKSPDAPVFNPAMAQRRPTAPGADNRAVVKLGAAAPTMSNKGGALRGSDRVAQLAQLKMMRNKNKRGGFAKSRTS